MKIGTTTITTTTTTFVTTSAWWWLLLLLLGPLGGGNNSNHRSKGHSFAIATFTESVCLVNGEPHNDEVTCSYTYACTEITNCKSVHCEGLGVCISAEIVNVDSVICEGFKACLTAEIMNAEVIKCYGDSSCAGAKIRDTGLIVCNGGDDPACDVSATEGQAFNISGDPLTTCLRCEGAKGCGQDCYFDGVNCKSEDAEFGECQPAMGVHNKPAP